jgi:hypothetical protein
LVIFLDVVVNPRGIVLRWIGGCRNAVLETHIILVADINQGARGAVER